MRKKEQQEIIQIMNILFFLTPKEDVAHVDEDDTMRQVLEKMEHHGYTAIPLLSREENISERSRRAICSGF